MPKKKQTRLPKLWVCYRLRNGELKVECLENVPDGEGIDTAGRLATERAGSYIYCSREKFV